MRTITLGLVVACVLLPVPPAYAVTPSKVLDDPKVDELSVAASVDYLAWSADSQTRQGDYNSYVQPIGGGHVERVNPKGTRSYSVGIDGSLVVYESATRSSDLALYDAATRTRPALPDGVNTKSREFRPSLSGDWLLFTRANAKGVKVILFDLSSGHRRVLRHARAGYLTSDQVNGDWATFEYCRLRHGQFTHCNVFLYRISTKTLTRLPNPGQQQYAGGVSADGTVYFTRTRNADVWRCGHHARIVRYPVGGPGTVIARIRTGFDPYATFATDETDGSTTVYLQRVRCSTQRGGIYAIENADTAT